jgi:hypothetical protein
VEWAKFDSPRPLYNEASICTMGISPDAKMHVDLDITTTVALIEGEPAGGEPLADLCETLRETTRIVLESLVSHT